MVESIRHPWPIFNDEFNKKLGCIQSEKQNNWILLDIDALVKANHCLSAYAKT